MGLSRDKLIFMGLVALDEIVEAGMTQPIVPSFALRALLAQLYAFAGGMPAPFRDFWLACQPLGDADPVKENASRAQYRSIAFNRICYALGIGQSSDFMVDLHLARRAESVHQRAYNRRRGCENSDRRRFAEQLRARGQVKPEDVARAMGHAIVKQDLRDMQREKDDKRTYYWRPPPSTERG